MVNTSQQVGGSIGTAVLSTLASGATSAFLTGRPASPAAIEAAAVHGYTTAFWWAAGIFAVGALVCGLVLRSGVPQHPPVGEPALAH
jgi:hypothetical protein